jgi:hypothetical protein
MSSYAMVTRGGQKRRKLEEEEKKVQSLHSSNAAARADLSKLFIECLAPEKTPLHSFLEPTEYLKLMHVCKETRKLAAPALAKLQQKHAVAFHQSVFNNWVQHRPIVKDQVSNLRSCLCNPRIVGKNKGGPIRSEAIRAMGKQLQQQFVVLDYYRNYDEEGSLVAFFDKVGRLVSIYKFEASNAYDVFETYEKHRFEIWASCPLNGTIWDLRPFGLKWDPPQWHDMPSWLVSSSGVFGNYSLFRSLEQELSPAELIFILMHVLTSDPRAIYSYLHHVYVHMRDDDFEVRTRHGNRYIPYLANSKDTPNFDELVDIMRDWKLFLDHKEYPLLLTHKRG